MWAARPSEGTLAVREFQPDDARGVLARTGNAGRADGFFPSLSYFSRVPEPEGGGEPGGQIWPAATKQPPPGGSKAAAISNLTVRLLSQYTGRGPTKARTFFNDDVVTIVLRDTLTKAERTLVDNDRRELVLVTRTTFQEVMGDDLIAGIEEILGRKVMAFLSANHIDPDIAVETFMLAPADQPVADPQHTREGADSQAA